MEKVVGFSDFGTEFQNKLRMRLFFFPVCFSNKWKITCPFVI